MLLDSLLAFEEVVMQPTLARKGKDGSSAGGSVTWRYPSLLAYVRILTYSLQGSTVGWVGDYAARHATELPRSSMPRDLGGTTEKSCQSIA